MEQVSQGFLRPAGQAGHSVWAAPFRADFWVGVFDFFALWAERREQRLMLGAMDDHMLSDLGLDRGQVEAEISKPFWLR